jgi:hypothetical protein
LITFQQSANIGGWLIFGSQIAPGHLFSGHQRRAYIEEGVVMNTWEAIFSQSPVNEGFYNGDQLPQVRWAWPRKTWFQVRLDQIRDHERAALLKANTRLKDARASRTM